MKEYELTPSKESNIVTTVLFGALMFASWALKETARRIENASQEA